MMCMIELGELEKHGDELAARGVTLYAISSDGPEDTRATQEQFPSLTIVSDSELSLVKTVGVLDEDPLLGKRAAMPTTFLIDGQGEVRWTYRSSHVMERLPPAELLAAIDEHIPASDQPSTRDG